MKFSRYNHKWAGVQHFLQNCFCSLQRHKSGPEVIKRFSRLTQLSMKLALLINLKLLIIGNSLLLNIPEHEHFSANKHENARRNFMLSWVEHEKSFITSGPACTSAQSDQSSQGILWVAKDTKRYQAGIEDSDQPACAGWSEFSLGAHAVLQEIPCPWSKRMFSSETVQRLQLYHTKSCYYD